MRQRRMDVLMGAALTLCAVTAGRSAALASARCDQPPAMNGNYVKPSSLAPGERAYNNAYGAPISKPIVSRRVHHKPKTQPQLHTSPLPQS